MLGAAPSHTEEILVSSRHPEWIRSKAPGGARYRELQSLMRTKSLNTSLQHYTGKEQDLKHPIDAIRYGLSGELIDFERGEAIPARARLEQLLEWVAPVAGEVGAAPFLSVPGRNAAERQRARHGEGATFAEIYAEEVRAGERVG